MRQRAWVATRKGLFELRQRAGTWQVERISFLGEPVSMVLPPTEGGRMYAALNLGHFGVKLHGSDDAGVTWAGGIWRSTDDAASWHEVTGVPVSNFGFAVVVHPGRAETAWFVPAIADQTRVPVNGAMAVNRTRDGGRSFETLRSGLPQRHCYDLVYRHGLALDETGQQLLMGSTTGNLWGSMDAGDHWAEVDVKLPPIYAVRMG